MPTCKVALVQMCSVNDVEENFAACTSLVTSAVQQGARLVCFPECFSFVGAAAGEAQRIAEPLDGPIMRRYCSLAREYKVWLSLGGFQEKPEKPARADEAEAEAEADADGERASADLPVGSRCVRDSANDLPKIFNTHVIVDEMGVIRASYRKMHLFDVPAVGLVESRQAIAGSSVGGVACDSPAGKLGLSVCYDIRFPELYSALRYAHAADVLLVPSAFAVETGRAHWETLLRCRAIETQCYVIGAAQAGQHHNHGNKRRTYGHAVAYDPWGDCVASFAAIAEDGSAETGVAVFEVDSAIITKTRQRMPLDAHRRPEMYSPPSPST